MELRHLMMSKIIQIKIAEPCYGVSKKLNPDEEGRHCARCGRTVVDFTKMPDYGMADYISHNPNICGRFHDHQIEKDIMVIDETLGWNSRFSKFAMKALPKMSLAGNILSDNVVTEDLIHTPILNSDGTDRTALTIMGHPYIQLEFALTKGEFIGKKTGSRAFPHKFSLKKYNSWKNRFEVEKLAFKTQLKREDVWSKLGLTFVFLWTYLIRWLLAGMNK